MTQPILLTSKEQICDTIGIGRTLFRKWVSRGLPVEKIDGRWTGQKERIETFFAAYIARKKRGE